MFLVDYEIGTLPSCGDSQVNNTLKRLDVSWNPFRSRGVIAIAEGLKPNLSVQSIDLAWVGMKDPGAEAIGAMLHLNQV